MAEDEPVADESSTTPRATSARGPANDADTYWLSTPGRKSQANVAPILGVWLDGALHIAVSQAMHEPGHLGTAAGCAVTTDPRGLELVVRGAASRVLDEDKLGRLAEVFAAKYQVPIDVLDGSFHGDVVRAAGPSPYDVYEVTPAPPGPSADSPSDTRWSF
ncbi:hypothetical protein ABGB17_14890 [Sphaerisporangium sp. B11E5]|uniref:hypothetical protein n=1 Tax=Sphaerisporangium sp. B11E5 TaxID=3153563 RepID=UPI00325D4DAA